MTHQITYAVTLFCCVVSALSQEYQLCGERQIWWEDYYSVNCSVNGVVEYCNCLRTEYWVPSDRLCRTCPKKNQFDTVICPDYANNCRLTMTCRFPFRLKQGTNITADRCVWTIGDWESGFVDFNRLPYVICAVGFGFLIFLVVIALQTSQIIAWFNGTHTDGEPKLLVNEESGLVDQIAEENSKLVYYRSNGGRGVDFMLLFWNLTTTSLIMLSNSVQPHADNFTYRWEEAIFKFLAGPGAMWIIFILVVVQYVLVLSWNFLGPLLLSSLFHLPLGKAKNQTWVFIRKAVSNAAIEVISLGLGLMVKHIIFIVLLPPLMFIAAVNSLSGETVNILFFTFSIALYVLLIPSLILSMTVQGYYILTTRKYLAKTLKFIWGGNSKPKPIKGQFCGNCYRSFKYSLYSGFGGFVFRAILGSFVLIPFTLYYLGLRIIGYPEKPTRPVLKYSLTSHLADKVTLFGFSRFSNSFSCSFIIVIPYIGPYLYVLCRMSAKCGLWFWPKWFKPSDGKIMNIADEPGPLVRTASLLLYPLIPLLLLVVPKGFSINHLIFSLFT